MTSILIIHKSGIIEEQIIDPNVQLFTICNYRNGTNFELLNTYSDIYEIYGKRKGKVGTENKYEFPLKEIYFGKVCIIKRGSNCTYSNLTLIEWNNIKNDTYSSEDNEVINDNELLPEEYEEEY